MLVLKTEYNSDDSNNTFTTTHLCSTSRVASALVKKLITEQAESVVFRFTPTETHDLRVAWDYGVAGSLIEVWNDIGKGMTFTLEEEEVLSDMNGPDFPFVARK